MAILSSMVWRVVTAAALACMCMKAQAAGLLNLSHDLVTKGIAPQNMTPNSPALDSRPLFEAALQYAAANNISTVIADTGNYYFLTLHTGNFAHVFVYSINNVTVDLQHSNLYFQQGHVTGIFAYACNNLTLENFTADYLDLPYTQLTVTGVNTTARTISVAPLGNYATPIAIATATIPANANNDGFYAFIFRDRKELATTGRMQAATPASNTTITLNGTEPWAQAAQLGTIRAGDTLVLEYRAGQSTIFADNSTGVTLHNLAVYSSGFIGVGTIFGSGITVDHVQVIPRPGTDRMISTNADGIHLTWAGANNVVSNNTVKRGCDDAYAIDGQWYAMVSAPNNGPNVQVARSGPSPLAIGTAFDFIDINNGTILGTATITAENPPVAQQTGNGGESLTLTLDHTIAGLVANYGVTPHDPALRGGGSSFSNNLVLEEVYARGIYPAGVSNVTISNNMIEYTNQAGILLEQDEGLIYGYKTGPSSGIAIQNNVVDHAVGFGIPGNPIIGFDGAINTLVYDSVFNWVSTSTLQNISITGNFVTNSPVSGIRMENVASGQLTGNTVMNYGQNPDANLWYQPAGETQAQLETEMAEPIVLLKSTGVTNTGNTTTNNITTTNLTGGWIANVSDADGGYRLAAGSIAVAYGQAMTTGKGQAGGANLPTTLGGISVTVKDSAGVSRQAGLYYVSANQIDYVVPPGTASGVATVTVGNQPSAALIGSVGPGLFSADGSGKGAAAALAILAAPNGVQTSVPVFTCSSQGCATTAMSLGSNGDILVLELYGTGISGFTSLANVSAEIGGVPATVQYAGAQSQYAGLDQVNLFVPTSLAGAGEVPVVLTVDGVTANVVTVNIK